MQQKSLKIYKNNIFNNQTLKDHYYQKIDSKTKIAIVMIKKENNHEIDKKNKNKSFLNNKYIEQQTSSDTPKKTSFKLRFISWLDKLPLDQRYLAVKVYAPGLARKIQEALIDLQNEPIQQIKKDSSVSKKISPKQAKQIIQAIVLISDGEDYFDNIGFDFTYIQYPDKLYQLLATTLTQHQKQMYQTQQYEIQTIEIKQITQIVQKSQSKQQLMIALINYLRGEIFMNYQQKKPINLQQERNRKKQFSMFWRNLSQQYKRKILLLNKDDYNLLSDYLADKKIYISPDQLDREIADLILMDKNQFCNKIFKCKLKKSLTYFTEYHQMVYKLWKNQLNKKKRKLRNSKFNDSQKPSTNNRNYNNQKSQRRYNTKNQKQHEITKRQKSKNNIQPQKSTKNLNTHFNQKFNQKQSKIIQGSNSANLNNQKSSKNNLSQNNTLSIPQNNQNGQNNTSSKRKKNRNRRKKSVSAQSKQTNTTSHKFERQQKQEYERKIEQQTSIASQSGIQIISSSNLTDSTLNSISKPYTLQDIKPKIPQLTYPKIDYFSQTLQKVKIDIQQYSDLINQEANEFYQRRLIAYERIQLMLFMWKIPIKLFGSCASGITIKNSDIDIAVDNSILKYFQHVIQHNRLKAALQQLEQYLKQQPWVTGLKLIKTAAIPLIKMKVNTSIKFVEYAGFQMYRPYIENLNRDHLSSGQIHIDLTVQTINKQLQSNHLGVISTDQINFWLKNIKSLHSIVIIIKNYLTKTNLNITYEGGLNTYSMICMIVAFIKANKLEQDANVVKVFQKVIKFYAYEFDQKTTGIDLLNKQQIFFNKLKLNITKSQSTPQNQIPIPQLISSKSTAVFCQADLQIKDPLNNGKNMTKNCYLFPKIRQIFQNIYKACFQQQAKQIEEIFKSQFKQRYLKNTNKSELTQESKEVRQLLNDCKHKLSNPFLILFE